MHASLRTLLLGNQLLETREHKYALSCGKIGHAAFVDD